MFYTQSTRRLDGLHNLSYDCQRSHSCSPSTRWLLLLFDSGQDWHGRIITVYFYFYVYLNTLDICLRWILILVWSVQYLEVFAPFLMVHLFIKVSNVFRGVSKVVREYLQLLPNELDSLSPFQSFQGSRILLPVLWPSEFLFGGNSFFYFHCILVPYDENGSKIIKGSALFRIGESSPCLLFPSSHDKGIIYRILIVPRVPNFLVRSPKFSEVMIPDCKWNLGNSAPLLCFPHHMT